MTINTQSAGLGCRNHRLSVSIGNIPNLPEYQHLETLQALHAGEIAHIGLQCGNGWRKVFNVYAKLVFALANNDLFDLQYDASSWQAYRDHQLLQKDSQTALLFAAPDLIDKHVIKIISGKTHAISLISSGQLKTNLEWLDSEFAVDRANRIFVCPYFDYRQLSNIKIERLVELIRTLYP